MRAVVALCFLLATSASAQARAVAAPVDPPILARAKQEVQQYFDGWRADWIGRFDDPRLKTAWGTGVNDTFGRFWIDTTQNSWRARVDLMWDAHCAAVRDNLNLPRSADSFWFEPLRIIRSAASAGAVCPAWLRDRAGPEARVARVSVDSLLRLTHDRHNAALARVLGLLDSAAIALPDNAWIAGQRVRLALDPSSTHDPLATASECTTNRWWCAALSGYVLAQQGHLLRADSAFAVATNATAGEARCQWTDVRALLPPDERREYALLGCSERDEISTRLFWLADPAWDQPGNERRTEHFARRVALLLRSSLERDEVYNWRSEQGGDALAEMILRYGWPSDRFWYGRTFDAGRDRQLDDRRSPPRSPHTIPEYTRDRVHLVPALRAMREPSRALPTDWVLRADTFRTPMSDHPILNSWQPEHFRHVTPIIPLGDFQTGVFCRDSAAMSGDMSDARAIQTAQLRRDGGILFGFATELAAANLSGSARDTVAATLLWSASEFDVRRVGVTRVAAGDRLTMHGVVPMKSGLIGVEIPGDGVRTPLARTRFGFEPPVEYAGLELGGRAVSPVILLDAPADSSGAAIGADTAISRMLGSTRLAAGTKSVGIYWEAYGFSPSDTVEIAVRVQRQTSQGALRTVGIALGLAADRNASITIAWTEPGSGSTGSVVTARVPTIGRNAVLEISSLGTGQYSIEMSVGRPGADPVRSYRSFILE